MRGGQMRGTRVEGGGTSGWEARYYSVRDDLAASGTPSSHRHPPLCTYQKTFFFFLASHNVLYEIMNCRAIIYPSMPPAKCPYADYKQASQQPTSLPNRRSDVRSEGRGVLKPWLGCNRRLGEAGPSSASCQLCTTTRKEPSTGVLPARCI